MLQSNVMRKLFFAWDADFTKLTPKESEELIVAHKQMDNGEYFTDDEIDWDNLDNMDLD